MVFEPALTTLVLLAALLTTLLVLVILVIAALLAGLLLLLRILLAGLLLIAMAKLDDATKTGRDTWHEDKKSWTPILLTFAIVARFLGIAAFVLVDWGQL